MTVQNNGNFHLPPFLRKAFGPCGPAVKTVPTVMSYTPTSALMRLESRCCSVMLMASWWMKSYPLQLTLMKLSAAILMGLAILQSWQNPALAHLIHSLLQLSSEER